MARRGCERGPATCPRPAATLFAAWKIWAEANGEFVGSIKRFSENLSSRGFEHYRDRRARGFRGLAPASRRAGTTEMEF